MLTISTTLAIFLMLGISSLGLFLAKRLEIPHTVLLVLIGIILGFLTLTPTFSFLGDFQLTPELLFYILLPTLIFESAYQMDIRKLVSDAGAVFALSIGSFLISTTLIASLLYFVLMLLGINVPISITLLFGALISATDPVAVLALFKEYGVPRRLSLIFEGESLFNDATAVAFFLIILAAIESGTLTMSTTIPGFLTFSSMLILGVLFGLLVGGIFAFLVGIARESQVASITLTIVLAHITFILAEVISQIKFFDVITLHISPIISTTVASLLMGNYGRAKMNPRAETIVHNIWEQFAFMANSLVFILIGVLMVNKTLLDPTILLIIFITILIVGICRAISIYPVISIYNFFQTSTKNIPIAWQHLMAWGSLRGALAVTMVLLIPDSLKVPGWTLDISPKDFLLAITIGCIAATLFIKATTIKKLVLKFNLDKLTVVEELEYQEARALIHKKVTEQLAKYQNRGYIDSTIAATLLSEHSVAYKKACNKVNDLSETGRDDLAFRVLRIYAIGIEKRHLKLLFDHKEITESVFRRIQGKLRLQLEAIEAGDLSPDVTIHADGRDVFEQLARLIKKLIGKSTDHSSFTELYMYYRAQTIISRKVLKELNQVEKDSGTIFTREAVKHVNDLYTKFKENSQRKLQNLGIEDPHCSEQLAKRLAKHSVHNIEETALDNIYKQELITPKLYILLKEELSAKVRKN